MELFKTYVYDHEIRKKLKLCISNKVQWTIKETTSDREYPMYRLAFSMDEKKYHVKSISYTGSLNPDIKKYSIVATENIMDEVEKEFPNINFTLKFGSKKKLEVNKEVKTEPITQSITRRPKI